jgi:hypothetical protein
MFGDLEPPPEEVAAERAMGVDRGLLPAVGEHEAETPGEISSFN